MWVRRTIIFVRNSISVAFQSNATASQPATGSNNNKTHAIVILKPLQQQINVEVKINSIYWVLLSVSTLTKYFQWAQFLVKYWLTTYKRKLCYIFHRSRFRNKEKIIIIKKKQKNFEFHFSINLYCWRSHSQKCQTLF